MATKKKGGLGRGLGNLLEAEKLETGDRESVLTLPVRKIIPNPGNPRKKFTQDSIDELAVTIEKFGLLQPILVRKTGDNYTVISGERRLRAVKKLGLEEIPVIIKEITDRENIEIALIENIQREQLDVMEEAAVYQSLLENYQLTQDELSERVGKNRSTIANRMRLLKLPPEIQAYLSDGIITEGQVRPLLGVKNARTVKTIADEIIRRNLSARTVETMVKNLSSSEEKPSPRKSQESSDMQRQLEEYLNTRVHLRHNNKTGKGKIVIEYFSLEEMENLLKIIGFHK